MDRNRNLWDKEAVELLGALLRLRSLAEAKCFVRDLMTEDEIRMVVDRWRVARMLDEGCSYRRIEQETGLSSRTIARISAWLRNGEGGYGVMVSRTKRKKKVSL